MIGRDAPLSGASDSSDSDSELDDSDEELDDRGDSSSGRIVLG